MRARHVALTRAEKSAKDGDKIQTRSPSCRKLQNGKRTKTSPCRLANGQLGHVGLQVLRCLTFDFLNVAIPPTSGSCRVIDVPCGSPPRTGDVRC